MAQSATVPSRAEAAITSLGYRLIDLTPDDGLAPWIDLAGLWGSMSASIQRPSGGTLHDFLDQHGQLSLSDGGNAVFGNSSSDGLLLSLNLVDRNTYIAGTSDYSFRLSPNTQVIFTADAQVASYSGVNDVRTAASASLYGSSYDGEQMPGTTSIGTSGTAQQSAMLEILYRSGSVEGGGFVSLIGSLEGMVSPVPEPSRLPILLLGLPVVYAAARRRRTGA